MAWSDFTAGLFTSGQILTAAQLNTYVRDNLVAGGPIYATEAARNAAITSPFEGQRAYITGSTITAPTGNITAAPTGIQTIYNGSAWVCVTPIYAGSSISGTKTTTGYQNTLTGDATVIAVTVATGTTALVSIGGMGTNSAAGVTQYMAVSVSGATTIAAADANGVYGGDGSAGIATPLSRQFVITGLTAGNNTFTLQYNTNSTSTATFINRSLKVVGIA